MIVPACDRPRTPSVPVAAGSHASYCVAATKVHGACVFLYFGDTLYSAFVALETILHGACVSLYFGDPLHPRFVALATILHGACVCSIL